MFKGLKTRFRVILVVCLINISVLPISNALETGNPLTISQEGGPNREGKLIKLSFVGDVLTHRSLYLKAKEKSGYNFDFAFKNIKKELDSDINFCQLETPLTDSKPSGYPVFRTPYQLASALSKAGFTICSQASNHSLDAGISGINYTKEKLNDSGIQSTGVADKDTGENFTIIEENGVKVAYLAYTYGTNGIKAPQPYKDLLNVIDLEKILKAAKEAKAKSDIVVLYMHWGQEYNEAVSNYQKNLAEKLTLSPYIDLIVGSHIHQLQRFELINHKPVLYGLGNFWSGQGVWSSMPKGQIGAIAQFNFISSDQGYRYLSGSVKATYVESRTWSIHRALPDYKGPDKKVNCFALQETYRLYSKLLKVDSKC